MGNAKDTQGSWEVLTKQQHIAVLGQKYPERSFTALAHHIDLGWLREAYRQTRKEAAVGVDRQTGAEYGEDLEENLKDLLERFKSGQYKAPPVRRVEIPKGKGETRPIGVPTFEDKVLQRAVVMLLEPLYEQDFLDCSYGFRPDRSAHEALEEIWQRLMRQGGGWVLEVDIRKYFDTLDWKQLREILDRRVRDGVIRRQIDKWLKAGVWEQGEWHSQSRGTPQGGVISPMLSNIYLHAVLDEWFEEEVQKRLKGAGYLVRFADDFVMIFELEQDARRVMEVLGKRLQRYGLTIHSEKTRLVEFRSPRGGNPGGRPRGGTFDFLGFTHYWGKSRKGAWVVQRKTSKNRLSRSLQQIHQWCRQHRHRRIRWQHRKLSQKVQGHYAYYGITGNGRSLQAFLEGVKKSWYKWLKRRSRNRRLDWERYNQLLQHYPLPAIRIVHSVYAAKP